MYKEIDVKQILADEDQPRKYFDAIKMKSLKESIAKEGILRPLDVEDMGNGKYLLEDGERRFRAAIELGLKSVPCNVSKLLSPTDRLIRQFNIQEQQESWTPIEKAMSLLSLSRALGYGLEKVCEDLHIPKRDAARYIAFANLADKESYVKNEIPLIYAQQIGYLKRGVKSLYRDELKQEFTKTDEKKIEHQITKQIVKGIINNKNDLTRLADAFRKNPKLIDKFMTKDTVTPDSLFLEAKAKGAYSLRNAVNDANKLKAHINGFLEENDVKVTEEQLSIFRTARTALNSIISHVE